MNRRSLFALAGCGGALLLAGCSTSNMWLDRQYDYSGELKFDSYRQNGDYREATRSEPAQNVPVPVLPAHADERSVAGLYSTIGYIFAFTEYIIESRNTGEAQPYMERYKGLTQEELDRMIGSGNSWFSKVRTTAPYTPRTPKRRKRMCMSGQWSISLNSVILRLSPGKYARPQPALLIVLPGQAH